MSADAADPAATARRDLVRLIAAAPALRAVDLPAGFEERIEHYVRLLLEANERVNLTRIVEPPAVARDHLLDALSALPLLNDLAPRTAVDVGAGGGVPGIVLALARPAIAWTLVDSVGKKADAMRSFVDALGLTDVTVLAARAEDLGRDATTRESFDLATARACAALPVLAEYALPLVRSGGSVLAWKGTMDADELERGRSAARILGGRVELRETGVRELGDRRFVLVSKRGPTPGRYPRRAGEPARRPLA